MIFNIPMNGFIGWECAVCRACVRSEAGIPVSKYWSVERGEVYCSAAHGLQRHEECRRKDSHKD